MTIKTDYKGQPRKNGNGFAYDQYSKEMGSEDLNIKSIVFNVSKTLKNFVSSLELNQEVELFNHTEIEIGDGEYKNIAAFVQNSYKPFDVIVSYSDTKNENDDKYLKNK